MARFLKNRQLSKGTSPGSLIFIGKQKMDTVALHVTCYNSEQIKETPLTSLDGIKDYISDSHMTWISVYGLHNTALIGQLGTAFEIPPLILEDVLNTDQRPRYSEDNDHIYIILKSLLFDKASRQIQSEQISVIVGKHYLISIQETGHKHFEDIYKRLYAPNSRIRSYASDYLCYVLVDTMVDSYILNIEALGSVIEEQEKVLLSNDHKIVEDIYHYKTELSYARKNVRPVKEVTSRFNNSDSPLIQERTYSFLRDLDDLMVQALEAIEIYYTMISDQLNIYHTNVSNRVNDVMKVLTIFSTIFIPLTFIAGVYGMNFDNIPELKYPYAYFVLWAIMITIVIIMLFYFKRKKWF